MMPAEVHSVDEVNHIFIGQYQSKIEILMIKGSKEILSVKELSKRFKRKPFCHEEAKKGPLIWNNGVTTVCSKSDPFYKLACVGC